ncbi:MAG: alkane 1-monooxygenase [Aliishimia sp.]
MDRFVARLMPLSDQGNALHLSVSLGVAHFILWALGIWAVGGGAHLNALDKVLVVTALGLFFGQISNSNAHELIHNAARAPRRLGVAIYGSILFAHHTSAHTRVHHVYAATRKDPNTARLGEGFWHYLIRAWPQGFIAGKRAEDHARQHRARAPWTHPYVIYLKLSLISAVGAFLIAGPSGVLALVIIAAYAQVQLYLSDYVQHYGLERRILDSGKPEKMGPEHSWNAPHWYSSAMMLNAPLHSDHHLNPARPFPELRLTRGEMPILPHSLPVMAVLALIPPLWCRLMDKRATRWRVKGASPPDAA